MDIERLKKAAEAATKEPWFFGADLCADKAEALEICRQNIEPTTNEIPYFYVVYLEDGRRIALVGNGPTSAQNSEYIVEAQPSAILQLIARLESAESELQSRAERLERELNLAKAKLAELESQEPPAHKGATHCENCGLTWLDDGLNPVGCPYCKSRS